MHSSMQATTMKARATTAEREKVTLTTHSARILPLFYTQEPQMKERKKKQRYNFSRKQKIIIIHKKVAGSKERESDGWRERAHTELEGTL